MSTRGPANQARQVATNPIVAGSIILLVTIIAVVISYSANRGLPFTPTYDVVAEVPDAAELIEGGSEVRLGGARVGLVQEIQAVRGEGDDPPFARLRLGLDPVVQPLPADTRVMVRPRSLLGAKYLDVVPGESEEGLAPGATLPLEQARPLVEIDEAFQAFDDETARGLQRTITGLGDGLAGRGSSVNQTISSLGRAIAPIERVLGVLAAPETDLRGFVAGIADVSEAFRPVAPAFGALIDDAAVTFGALAAAGDALEASLVELPPTEAVGTRTLTRIRPVLDDAAAIARDIRPATRIIGGASRRLSASLRDSTPVLRRIPSLAPPLITTLNELDRLATKPATAGALRGLIAATPDLTSTLRTLTPSQTVCNIGPIFFRNAGSALSQGDGAGNWLSFTQIIDTNQMFQRAQPSPNLHSNPYPNEDASECEAGNEPFAPGQQIGNPPGQQSTQVDQTSPPPEVTARARRAGLLRTFPGGGR